MPVDQEMLLSLYSKSHARGLLVDVTPQARQLGFQAKVSISESLLFDCLIPPSLIINEKTDFNARLNDLLVQVLVETFDLINPSGAAVEWFVLTMMLEFQPVRIVSISWENAQERLTVIIVLPEDENSLARYVFAGAAQVQHYEA